MVYNLTVVAPRCDYRTLIGSYTLPIKHNHWRAAVMTP